MLLATLNHNLPTWTDNLVAQLQRDSAFEKCELLVLDNGSYEPLASTTTHRLEENVYFGGGFNVVLDYFLQSKHEYLYFLNNDLVFHGPAFLTTSLREAQESEAAVYSATIINASVEQCHWRQMWNWGKGLREVRWIDFQAPLIRRDILEHIQQFPAELIHGWGLDFYAGCVAESLGLKTIVSDNNTITHMNSLTFKKNKINIGVSDFCQRAELGMYNYFSNSVYKDLYFELRSYGENYTI